MTSIAWRRIRREVWAPAWAWSRLRWRRRSVGHKHDRERGEMAAVVGSVVQGVVVGGGVVVNRDNQRQEGRQEPGAPQLQCVSCWLMFARILPDCCTICVSFTIQAPASAFDSIHDDCNAPTRSDHRRLMNVTLHAPGIGVMSFWRVHTQHG